MLLIMSTKIEDILRAIRKDCRLAMNGVVSTSMREYGLDYKLNFGLVNQQIKGLADKYRPSEELAECLWKESTRELKILGTMIYPIDRFTEERAIEWIKDVPNQEIREQICFNLLQNLSYAESLAVQCMKNPDDNIRTTGYWLMTRLLLTKKSQENTILDRIDHFIWNDIISEDSFLRKASLSVLKYLVRQSKEQGQQIVDQLKAYNDGSNTLELKAYQEIISEFDFMYL